MSITTAELQKRLDDYNASAWDTDHPNYDPTRHSVSDTFSALYYGELEVAESDHYSYITFPSKPFEYKWPGVGTLNVLEDYEQHEDGHTLYVVFSIEGSTFQYSGWTDSWSGDGGWEGPLEKVEAEQVTVTRYRLVEDE